MRGIVIAGTNSGCGKTTVTIGLMRLLAERGHKIAPFKTGPDFIDPAFHSRVTGTSSYNLDTFLMRAEVIKHLYAKHTENKDFAVVEGVMGLYDGMGDEATGSAAELSKLLDLPVLLVVSCKSMYQSVAAIVSGFKHFDPQVNVAGVILNHVPNADSYVFLKKYIETHAGVLCVGYLQTNMDISLESRHLGLVQAGEVIGLDEKIEKLTAILRETIDVELLEKISTQAKLQAVSLELAEPWKRDLSSLRLAVARDHAFQFYYHDNLELLEENGAELVYFSPLNDAHLPPDIDAIYIGGGYPEVFAKELSENKSMLQEMKTAAVWGLPIFAECGGLMYLTDGIEDGEGHFNPMVGVFNCKVQMTARLQRFGYCNVSYNESVTRAHEFHRSRIIPAAEEPNYTMSYQLTKPEKNKSWTCGLKYKNVLGGYAHFHFWSEPLFYHQIIDLWMQKTI
jgi:cobyrinic acid a,c-diamide synthase